jgi:hypothetical protein
MLKFQNLKNLPKKLPTIYFQIIIKYFFATKMSPGKLNNYLALEGYVKNHFFLHMSYD